MAYQVRIVLFEKLLLPQFIALNCLYQLEKPQETILEKGGEIFIVLEGERVAGTCAMIPHSPNEFELAKMAVSPEARGKGYGDLLMETAISWAREKRVESIVILSNTVLEPAIALYCKHQAKIVHLGSNSDYKRCNIEMRISLRNSE